MLISTSLLSGVEWVLQEEDIDVTRLLRRAGIDPTQFVARAGLPELDLPEQLLRATLQALDTPGLALLFGTKAPLPSLGVVGGIVQHAPSLRRAIAALDTYAALVSPHCALSLREHGARASLVFASPFVDPYLARFCAEVAFAFALRFGKQHCHDFTVHELRFRNAAGSSQDRLRALFRCPVHYGAQRNEMVIAAGSLDLAQPFEDPGLWHLYQRRGDQLLVQDRVQESFHERIEFLLRHEVDLSAVTVASIARRLHRTPRSLRRSLLKEGYPLAALTEKVRREMALRALAESDVPIKEIAKRSGYGCVSTFHRAVKRWTGGIPPARFRSEASTRVERAQASERPP